MGCGSCEKPKVNYRRGLWSPDEDQRLRDYVLKHGLSCWSKVPAKAGLQRNGKSCRLRWINYLRPGLKRGNFSKEEEQTVIKLQSKLGNKWSQIAMYLPGRTDNEVKNHWNSYLKKKVIKAQKSDTPPAISNSSSPDCPNQEEDPRQQTPPFAKYAEAVDSSQYNPFPKVLFGDCLALDQANADDGSLNLEQVMRNSLQNTSSGLQAAAGSIMNEFGDGCVFEEIQEQPDEWIGQIPEIALFDVFGGAIYDKMDFGTESLD